MCASRVLGRVRCVSYSPSASLDDASGTDRSRQSGAVVRAASSSGPRRWLGAHHDSRQGGHLDPPRRHDPPHRVSRRPTTGRSTPHHGLNFGSVRCPGWLGPGRGAAATRVDQHHHFGRPLRPLRHPVAARRSALTPCRGDPRHGDSSAPWNIGSADPRAGVARRSHRTAEACAASVGTIVPPSRSRLGDVPLRHGSRQPLPSFLA